MDKTKNGTENLYADIMHMPHHVSKTRIKMSMEERAAQFAPFAALSGNDDVVLQKLKKP